MPINKTLMAIGDALVVAAKTFTVTNLSQTYDSTKNEYLVTVTVSDGSFTCSADKLVLSVQPTNANVQKVWVYSGGQSVGFYN